MARGLVRLARTVSLVLAVGLAGLVFVSPAGAEIYHWTDERGIDHYSDREEDVPEAFREPILSEAPEAPAGPADFLSELSEAFSAQAEEGSSGTDTGPAADAPFEMQRMMERFEGPMLLVAGLAGFAVLGFVLAFVTLALLVACRMVGQESPGFRKAYGVVLVQFLAGLVVGPGVVVVLGQPEATDLGAVAKVQAINFVAMLFVNAAVLRAMLCDGFPRSLGLAIVVNLVLLFFGIVLVVGAITCAGGAALMGGAG